MNLFKPLSIQNKIKALARARCVQVNVICNFIADSFTVWHKENILQCHGLMQENIFERLIFKLKPFFSFLKFCT